MMSSGQQVTAFVKQTRWVVYCLLCMMMVSSCIPTVKKAMIGKTFVYQTDIEIKGNMPGYQKRELAERLQNQLDDSLKVRVVSWAGIVMNYVNPPIFDTVNIGRSKVFMTALLKSNGYFQSSHHRYLQHQNRQWKAPYLYYLPGRPRCSANHRQYWLCTHQP